MERSWPAAAELLARAVAAGPGVEAMGLLVRVRAEHLDDHDRVTLLAAWAAQDGWLTARRTAAVVAVVGPLPKPSGRSTGDPRVVDEESVTAEVACALRVSDATATAQIATARALHGPLAAALPAVADGRWGFGHLRVVETELALQVRELLADGHAGGRPVADRPDDATRAAADAVIASVLSAVLPHAAVDTPGRLRRRIRTALARVDAGAATERARAAAAVRRVSLDPLPDLVGDLRITGPWAQVAWIHRVVDTWARRRLDAGPDGHARDDEAGRPQAGGLDALRVDGFTEAARLLAVSMGMAGAPVPDDAATVAAVADHLERTGRAVVAPDGPAGQRRSWSQAVVVLPAATALGLADDPGLIPGYGPVPAAVARELLATADTWRAFLTDTAGRLVDVSRRRYRPTARLRELVTARDATCTFPGCARPAVECELDHDVPFDGANTTASNLRPRCTRHHRLKTHGGWTSRPATGAGPPGRTEWTSPSGRRLVATADPPWSEPDPPPRVDLVWPRRRAA